MNCPNCGTPLNAYNQCPNCGFTPAAPAAPPAPDFKVPAWVYILCILVPGLGIAVMTGLIAARDKRAWSVLICTLIPTIISIIAVAVLIGSAAASASKYF